jgi:hypothetical protein
MGEEKNTRFRFEFNPSIKVETRPERLTGDAGVLFLREAMHRLGVERFLKDRLYDSRDQRLITHPLIELIRTSIFLIAQGWRDQDDADALRHDPSFKIGVSERRGDAALRTPRDIMTPDGLASQPTLSRLYSLLAADFQREVLDDALFQISSRRLRATRGHRLRYVTLDVDSLPIDVHGRQEGSAYNGYYRRRIYHPLVAMVAETGDLMSVRLREGNVGTANGGLSFILPLLDKMEKDYCQVASVRIDAGFPEDKLLSALEARGTGYVSRIRKNKRLNALAEKHLVQSVVKEPRESFHELTYKADKWSRERRVVLVIQRKPEELFPHYFFLLTNWTKKAMPGEDLLSLYRERGTAEAHIGEFVEMVGTTLSSTQRPKSHYRGEPTEKETVSVDPFAVNEVKLLLSSLAYGLLHTCRVLIGKATREGWRLGRVVERVLKVPARFLLHSKQVVVVPEAAAAANWGLLKKRLMLLHQLESRAG